MYLSMSQWLDEGHDGMYPVMFLGTVGTFFALLHAFEPTRRRGIAAASLLGLALLSGYAWQAWRLQLMEHAITHVFEEQKEPIRQQGSREAHRTVEFGFGVALLGVPPLLVGALRRRRAAASNPSSGVPQTFAARAGFFCYFAALRSLRAAVMSCGLALAMFLNGAESLYGEGAQDIILPLVAGIALTYAGVRLRRPVATTPAEAPPVQA